MILSVALAGAAAAVLFARPPSARRLQALVPSTSSPAASPNRRPTHTAVLALAGIALGVVIGGPPGIAVGLCVALLGPLLIGKLDDTADEGPEVVRALPLALDLIGAGLAGGGSLQRVVEQVSLAMPGPLGQRLGAVGAALAVGCAPDEALRALGDNGPAGTVARSLSRAAEGGTPVVAAVARVAAETRRVASVEARKRARRAGIAAVGPLGACFLPAFMLLGVVPTIVGLAGPMFSSF